MDLAPSLRLLLLAGTLALLPLGWLWWRRPQADARRRMAGLMALMILTHFLALERVETAYMISVKRTSILFGILLGHLFFNEHGVARNLVASGVMVIGVAMIIV